MVGHFPQGLDFVLFMHAHKSTSPSSPWRLKHLVVGTLRLPTSSLASRERSLVKLWRLKVSPSNTFFKNLPSHSSGQMRPWFWVASRFSPNLRWMETNLHQRRRWSSDSFLRHVVLAMGCDNLTSRFSNSHYVISRYLSSSDSSFVIPSSPVINIFV